MHELDFPVTENAKYKGKALLARLLDAFERCGNFVDDPK